MEEEAIVASAKVTGVDSLGGYELTSSGQGYKMAPTVGNRVTFSGNDHTVMKIGRSFVIIGAGGYTAS